MDRSNVLDYVYRFVGDFEKVNITINKAELSTILGALRVYQRCGMGDPANRSDDIHDIATDGDSVISLCAADIDALCERING